MPPIGQDASGSAAYRPTSLDFINLPNPIEPHTQAQKHPLNGTPRLEKARLENSTNQDLFKFILEPCNERSSKRLKATDNTLLDLPKLPVRNAAKRLRIPPTLSGLHQPPPDAGLLPSISVEQPQVPPPRHHDASISHKSYPDRPVAAEQSYTTPKEGLNSSAAGQPSKSAQNKLQRNKWTDGETADLLKGVAQFGIGSWTKILNCADYHFRRRTALDLKDRFRVCCPEHYTLKAKTTSRKVSSIQAVTAVPNEPGETVPEEPVRVKTSGKRKIKGPASERLSSAQLKDFGVDEPFTKSGRRSRHGYSSAEDEAILRGFQKYGKSWSSIRKDTTLNLMSRNPRDLRDRMRTRYPEEYAKAGLALPAEKSSNKRDHAATVELEENEVPEEGGRRLPLTAVQEDASNKEELIPNKTAAKRPAQHSIFILDDVFLNEDPRYHDGEYTEEREPIILDRGILDWAPRTNTANNNGIDPLMTLKLPKPVATAHSSTVHHDHMHSVTSQNLPSLAELWPSERDGEGQLELPSLMGLYSSNIDEGGRNGILSLEELLS